MWVQDGDDEPTPSISLPVLASLEYWLMQKKNVAVGESFAIFVRSNVKFKVSVRQFM